MSEEGGEKKSAGGHIAIALAGIGALFARTADDCGKVAVKSGGAFKSSAALSDDALRGGSKVGSLADDGLRGGKYGSLADDGVRAGKYGPLADDSLRGGKGFAPHGDGSLIEEASAVGTKAESHAGDVAEFGVDVSLEVVSNVPPGDDDTPAASEPSVGMPQKRPDSAPKFETLALLRARSTISQPAILPVMPKSAKAFQAILGRKDKPDDASAFIALKPTPDDGTPVLDPLQWLKGRLSHNPIALVFYTSDATGAETPIPLILPNGGTTSDSAMHRACIEHFSHCIVLVCKPEKPGSKELCAKTVVDNWQTVAASSDSSLQSLLEKLIAKRAATPALQQVAISRVDLSKDAPRIVRSRLVAKKP